MPVVLQPWTTVYMWVPATPAPTLSTSKETVETAQAQQGPRNIPLANTTYVFDGTTENVYQTADNTIPFTVTDNIDDKNYLEAINILDGGTVEELIEKLQKSKGLSVEEATNVVKTSLYNNLRRCRNSRSPCPGPPGAPSAHGLPDD